MTSPTPPTREDRRAALNRKTKRDLIRICTRGVRTPDGGIAYIEGGIHPLEQWRKDEIADSIVRAEYGPLPSETATAAAPVQLGLFPAADATGTPDMFDGGLL